ncbi:S1 family peptidase [Methyloradius palustris]|uniref:Serine protease n=1 Tax=Methyloradius palustris TaxID=2778876 RepID=A0A8E4BU48_9PROT|nr:serine protease [Methyloradius palustris]BCM26212.1 hypothetical protein ZMTM_24710 [Methyloradius palustris]
MRQTILPIIFASISINAYAEPTLDQIYTLKGSIVKINTATKSGARGVGSGVVVAEDYVATNCHVLTNAVGVNVTAHGDTFNPVAVKEDWRHDVCLLKVDYLGMKPVVLADSESPQYEQSIFSIGFQGGAPKPQTTFGNVKALYPLDDGMVIRTSDSFMLGASGSPIFDDEGKLYGLNTFKSPGHDAYYFGVPVKWIKALLNAPDLKELGQSGTPFWDSPEGQQPFFMRIVLPVQNKDWVSLKSIAQDWQSKEPTAIEASYYLALAEENLGETKAAQQLYGQVLKANPRHTASMLALAKLAKTEGNVQELQRLTMLLKDLNSDAVEELGANLQ